MVKITDTDKKILFELDKNCRRSVKEIAKKLRLNRDTVAYRIRQLEKNKVITNYYALIDYSKIGYILVRLYLKFQNTTLEAETEMTNNLREEKSNLTAYKAEGNWDFAGGFLVTNLKEFHLIYREFKAKYKKYIHEDNVTVFFEFIHYFKNYLVNKDLRDYTQFSTGNNEKISFDKKDLEILKLISGNGKISFLDIANKVKLTSATVRYRIKQLEKKKVILAYRALINYSKFGYEYYKIDLNMEDVSKIKEIEEYTKMHPQVVYEDRAIGGSDFEFDVELRSYDEFYALIEDLKRKFPGVIRTYKYYKARQIYNYVFFPEE